MITDDVDRILDEGMAIIRQMLRFDFDTGTYGFWTGVDVLNYNGLDYLPGGVLNVGVIGTQYGMNATGLEISLASSPNDGLTPEVLASIEAEIYHQRPVLLSFAFFHPETRKMLHVEPVFRGIVDQLEHTGGTEPGIIMHCESYMVNNARHSHRMRSDADQDQISTGDKFFHLCESAAEVTLEWGKSLMKGH